MSAELSLGDICGLAMGEHQQGGAREAPGRNITGYFDIGSGRGQAGQSVVNLLTYSFFLPTAEVQ